MQQETLTSLKHNMLFHLRPELKNRPELQEEDFLKVFQALESLLSGSKIPDRIWAFVMFGLVQAIKGRSDGGKKADVRTDLG